MRTRNIQFLAGSMAFLFAAMLLVSHVAAAGDTPQNSDNDRKVSEIRRELKAFMKNSKSDNAVTQRAAIYNLCQLHCLIVQDHRFDSSQPLQGMRVVTANRLKEFVKQEERKKLRAERDQKKSDRESASAADSPTTDSSSVASNSIDDFSGSNKIRTESRSQSSETASNKPSTNKPTIEAANSNTIDAGSNEDAHTYQAAYDSHAAMGSFSGGAIQTLNYVDGQAAPPWDHGQDLVELIENTINPASWRSNGGSGNIHYFQPLRVLVVGASSQVHEDTLDLLRKLRAAQ